MTNNSTIDLNNPSLIRQKGIEALTDALRPLGMVKFMQQFGGGTGNYTKERKELLDGITMDDFKRWCEENGKIIPLTDWDEPLPPKFDEILSKRVNLTR